MGGRRLPALALVAIVVGLLVASLGPGLGPPALSPLPSGLPFRHLLQGRELATGERGYRVLRSPQALEAFWAEAGLGGPPPGVDFNGTTVVAVLMGQRPSGGFAIEVTSVVRLGPEVLLGVVESSPGAGCAPPPGPTEPYDIVAFPASGGEVLALHRSRAVPC